jgi:hypothetical protein
MLRSRRHHELRASPQSQVRRFHCLPIVSPVSISCPRPNFRGRYKRSNNLAMDLSPQHPGIYPVILALVLCIPKGFPYHGNPELPVSSFKQRLARFNLARADFIGFATLLLATLGFVTAVEEAGLSVGWDSPFVICLFLISGLLWIAFLLWERKITPESGVVSQEPVFPWRFATSRIWVGMLM